MPRSLLVLLVLAMAAHADPPPRGVLLVEATAARTAVHASEPFAVAVTMTNPGQTAASVAIWSCSWQDQWQSDDPQFAVLGSECSKNFPTTVTIDAHGHDTRSLAITVARDVAPGAHGFRLGFTPTGGKPIWTGQIAVTIVAVATDVTITGKGSKAGIGFALANSTGKPIELGDHLQLQRWFDGAWVDLSELSASACAAPPPSCVTLAPHASLARTWDGMVCAQCTCARNGRAQPGRYRLVAHACDGRRDFVGAEAALPADK